MQVGEKGAGVGGGDLEKAVEVGVGHEKLEGDVWTVYETHCY